MSPNDAVEDCPVVNITQQTLDTIVFCQSESIINHPYPIHHHFRSVMEGMASQRHNSCWDTLCRKGFWCNVCSMRKYLSTTDWTLQQNHEIISYGSISLSNDGFGCHYGTEENYHACKETSWCYRRNSCSIFDNAIRVLGTCNSFSNEWNEYVVHGYLRLLSRWHLVQLHG